MFTTRCIARFEAQSEAKQLTPEWNMSFWSANETVRDAYSLKLNCGLVTLSGCETGMNAVAPGDELMGLARGFFSAGSPTVMLSLWTIDDEATVDLMVAFYREL